MFTKKLPTLALLSFLPLITAIGCTAPDSTVIQQADTMNKQLAPAVMNDQQLQSYLQQVGERIIAAAKEMDAQHIGPESHFSSKEDNSWMFGSNMKFHFVNSKTLNAFTTGGEHMYVYNALFQECKSEDELAAVMAHEYAHVYCRHVGKGMQRQYTALAAAAGGGLAGYLLGGKEHGSEYAALGATAGGAGGQFLNMGFTRKDEDQADEYGFQFYCRAGWDPNHFADFFQHMIDKGYDKTPAVLSDHPTLASRVEATKKRAAELPPQAASWRKPPIANPTKFHQLQALAAADSKRMPDDSTLQNSQQLLQALPRSCVVPAPQEDELQARKQLEEKANKAAAQQQQPQSTDPNAQPTTPKKKRKSPAPAE